MKVGGKERNIYIIEMAGSVLLALLVFCMERIEGVAVVVDGISVY